MSFRFRNEIKLPKQFMKSWAADHGFHIVANNYMYNTSLLANIYIYLNIVVIK